MNVRAEHCTLGFCPAPRGECKAPAQIHRNDSRGFAYGKGLPGNRPIKQPRSDFIGTVIPDGEPMCVLPLHPLPLPLPTIEQYYLEGCQVPPAERPCTATTSSTRRARCWPTIYVQYMFNQENNMLGYSL